MLTALLTTRAQELNEQSVPDKTTIALEHGKMTQGKQTESERQAALEAIGQAVEATVARAVFSDRGFSERTKEALIAHGIDAPERLLFASYADLKSIPSIGKASFEEIMRYRTRFIPEW